MAREDMESDLQDDLEFEAYGPGAQAKPPGRMAGFFLLWAGLGLALVGVALPTAQYLSLPDYQIGERLALLNIENGELLVGGLLLLAMGLVSRATVRAARSNSGGGSSSAGMDNDFILLADQLATDVAQCLTSVMQVSEEVAAMAQIQREFQQTQNDDESNTDRQENAIFRLAASLDKLNAHIDERVHGLDVQIRSHFDNITNAVHETRQMVESHLAGNAAYAAPRAAAPAPAPAPMQRQQQQQQQRVEEPKIDFFENMEMGNQPVPTDFASPLGNPGQPRPSQAQPQPPLPGSGKSNLDALLPDDSIQRALDQNQFPGMG